VHVKRTARGLGRIAKHREGQLQVERLIEDMPAEHRYRYAILSTGLPVHHCMAELRSCTPAVVSSL
jgi:hypothetical protein